MVHAAKSLNLRGPACAARLSCTQSRMHTRTCMRQSSCRSPQRRGNRPITLKLILVAVTCRDASIGTRAKKAKPT